MERLPIYDLEERLVVELEKTSRAVISAPTGSGKSTQVPQMLLRNGFLDRGQAIVLQPRRLATRLLAKRVAEELGVGLGREVGYQIRLEHVASAATRIKFVTEGILLRMLLQDPSLRGVGAIIFDEFHERHLYGDVTLAQALEIQGRHRSDLRLLVMSATLEAQALEDYLRPCARLETTGRNFPVEIEYATHPAYSDSRPVWEQAAAAFADCARRGETGDVLVFMPGSFEIQRTLDALRGVPEARGFLLLPLHGELPARDQDDAVARQDRPKIVVATNVAETSLTIDGIRLVIDSGLARLPRHDPGRGINTLLIEPISRASADQRAGRAGRTAPGTCVRLWTLEEHTRRPAQEEPEIRRLDLTEVVLNLKAGGVEDLRSFPWLEPPPEPALAHAEALLEDLGALQETVAPCAAGRDERAPTMPPGPGEARLAPDPQDPPRNRPISDLGRRMASFPLHPRYARLLLAAQDHGCVYHAALIAALTQGRDLLLRRVDRETTKFRDDRLGDRGSSDFIQLIRAWEYAAAREFNLDACQRVGVHAQTARQVAPLHRMFLDAGDREGMDITPRELDETRLRLAVLLAFPDHLARRVDAGTLRCEMVRGRRGVLARESVVQDSSLLVAADVREIGGRDGEVNTLISLATAVEVEWLESYFSKDLRRETRVFYDAATRRVGAEECVRFRGLTVAARRMEPAPVDAAARLLADEVLAGRIHLSGWDHAVEQWILRVNNLARWCPEFQLPPITEADRRELVAQICHGAFSQKEIKDRPVMPVVQGWISAAQQPIVQEHAPERLELSNGRRPKLTYVADGPPFIALRIQELYEVTQTPRVASGRVPVTVHILAPNMRDVQVTQDLPSFWREHYPRLRSELRRKYPKHEWR